MWDEEGKETSKRAFSRELLLRIPGAQSLEGPQANSTHTSEFSCPKGKEAGILSHPSLTESFLEALTALLSLSGPSLLADRTRGKTTGVCM